MYKVLASLPLSPHKASENHRRNIGSVQCAHTGAHTYGVRVRARVYMHSSSSSSRWSAEEEGGSH